MEMIHNSFDPMEIKMCGMMSTELRGHDKLVAMADAIYGDQDPTMLYASSSPMSFVTEDGIDYLNLKMPFVDGGAVELFRINSNTLMIHVGSQKCNIQLPDSLIGADIVGADFKDSKLIVKFKRE